MDDDDNVVDILKILVEQQLGGEVAGFASNGVDALDELAHTQADIVLVDLLMPLMDGIAFVGKAKEKYPAVQFVMLSQVADKEMVAKAYENGIEFFIQKPVNAIEVKNVLQKVEDERTLHSTFSQLQNLLKSSPPSASAPPEAPPAQTSESGCEEKADAVLHSLGLGAEPAAKEIKQLVAYINAHPREEKTVAELCSLLSPNPKTLEQRIRRAVNTGLVNLASRGIEDFTDPVFTEYSGTLYKFEQVRREMEYLRKGSGPQGKAAVRPFLYNLAAFCE